jgi:hypothetical protein
VLALVFDQSRKPQFRCELCDTIFSCHTIRSRFFQLFWAWFIFSVVLLFLLLLYDVGVEMWHR